jgi:hypothetical protein
VFLHGKKGLCKKDKKRVMLWQDLGTTLKNLHPMKTCFQMKMNISIWKMIIIFKTILICLFTNFNTHIQNNSNVWLMEGAKRIEMLKFGKVNSTYGCMPMDMIFFNQLKVFPQLETFCFSLACWQNLCYMSQRKMICSICLIGNHFMFYFIFSYYNH